MAQSIELRFCNNLQEKYKKFQKYLIPKDNYYKTIEDIKAASESSKTKSRYEYYVLNKYDIFECGDVQKMIKKRKTLNEPPLYYASIEKTFDIIKKAHVATGYGGSDRMMKILSVKYANILRDGVELFKSMCMECQKKRKRPMTKVVVVRPILTSEFASRGQIDLIDLQSMPHNSFSWIMVYKDHLTKFCVLRCLTSKRATEVPFQLADIFSADRCTSYSPIG